MHKNIPIILSSAVSTLLLLRELANAFVFKDKVAQVTLLLAVGTVFFFFSLRIILLITNKINQSLNKKIKEIVNEEIANYFKGERVNQYLNSTVESKIKESLSEGQLIISLAEKVKPDLENIIGDNLISKEENLQFVQYNSGLGIRTCSGKYITAAADSDPETDKLFVQYLQIGHREIFRLKNQSNSNKTEVRYGDKIAIESTYRKPKSFLRAQDEIVKADRDNPRSEETFTLIPVTINPNNGGLQVFQDCLDKRAKVKFGDLVAFQVNNRPGYITFTRGNRLLRQSYSYLLEKEGEVFVFSSTINPL